MIDRDTHKNKKKIQNFKENFIWMSTIFTIFCCKIIPRKSSVNPIILDIMCIIIPHLEDPTVLSKNEYLHKIGEFLNACAHEFRNV